MWLRNDCRSVTCSVCVTIYPWEYILLFFQTSTPTPQAQKVLSELEAVLDDEAAAFVFKLYRMVIFETEKYAQLGSVDS